MSLAADLATLRSDHADYSVALDFPCTENCTVCAALDRVEAELARLTQERDEMVARDRYDAMQFLYIDMQQRAEAAERALADADRVVLAARLQAAEQALDLACADLAGTPVEAARLRAGYERAARRVLEGAAE